MKNKTNLRLIYIFLFLFGMVLFVNMYLSMDKNTKVQPYLNAVYAHSIELRKTHSTLVNPDFRVEEKDGIYIARDFLTPAYFELLKSKFDDKAYKSRNFGVKKGAGVDFVQMHQDETYRDLLVLYYSEELTTAVSNIMKKPIQRTPLSDPNAESVIAYVDENDNINWHLDTSNYYGDRYVALITLINENADKSELSAAKFEYKINGKDQSMKMPENSLMIFKGSEIMHRGTSIDKNERRILLSMVLCDICQERKNIFTNVTERVKNFVNYG